MLVSRIIAGIAVFAASGIDFDDEQLFEQGHLFGVIDLVGLPLHVRDLIFLGHVDPTSLVGGTSGGGVAVLGVTLLIIVGSLAYLLRRYREVG